MIPSSDPAAVDELFGYTGREWDSDVKLQYNRARWYDPAQGRWLSQDPLGFSAGDVNLYRYVGNGTIGATDPSGLEEYNRYAWHWHHLLTQNEFNEDFVRRDGLQGLDIGSEKFGWMLQAKDHIECGGGIHPAGWSRDWADWIKRKEKAGVRITPGMIRGKLANLMG